MPMNSSTASGIRQIRLAKFTRYTYGSCLGGIFFAHLFLQYPVQDSARGAHDDLLF